MRNTRLFLSGSFIGPTFFMLRTHPTARKMVETISNTTVEVETRSVAEDRLMSPDR
jgi:hypothetical protein